MAGRKQGILDEEVIRSLEAPLAAKEDAIAFGKLAAAETTILPENVECLPYPPDGIKATLTNADRRLTVFFFGDGRFVYGKKSLATGTRDGEGEISLSEAGRGERIELFHWLRGVSPP